MNLKLNRDYMGRSRWTWRCISKNNSIWRTEGNESKTDEPIHRDLYNYAKRLKIGMPGEERWLERERHIWRNNN